MVKKETRNYGNSMKNFYHNPTTAQAVINKKKDEEL
jgi:hypothetical protein